MGSGKVTVWPPSRPASPIFGSVGLPPPAAPRAAPRRRGQACLHLSWDAGAYHCRPILALAVVTPKRHTFVVSACRPKHGTTVNQGIQHACHL